MIVCFIATKGRTSTQTYKLFESAGIKVYHFIEPYEYDLYNVPNKINILQNNQGLAYVRNFKLDYAKRNGFKYVIFCDDDVLNFYSYVNGLKEKTDGSLWFNLLEKSKKLPFEMIGINYVQFAWCAKKNVSINSKFADVCVLLNIEKINHKFRSKYGLKVDRDFLLQTIKNGNGVIFYEKYCFDAGVMGKNGSGGLSLEYEQRKDEHDAKLMFNAYKGFASIKVKKERIDFAINFKEFCKFYRKPIL
jgi:hypothetical protein